MPATYEPIATTTLGVQTVTVTFSSIPSTYTDLRVVMLVNDGGGNANQMRFNGDTATNYSTTRLTGNGTAASSDALTTQTVINLGNTSASAGIFTYTAVNVFSYAGSTYKTALVENNQDLNGSGFIRRNVGMWRSTAAITSLSIVNGGASGFIAGSTFTLYGIKAA